MSTLRLLLASAHFRGRAVQRASLVIVGVLIAAGAILMRPLAPAGLGPDARPARSYAEGERLARALAAEDDATISTVCRTGLLTHGARTARVIVLFHGLTNCPAQFDSLAAVCFARGANVFVPRLPRHGAADRMTDALAGSDARELRAFTDQVIDAAAGLGDTVVVAGLSLGGTMAAWAAQNRADVGRAVVIAPLLAPPRLPDAPARLATRLATMLPNLFLWWDDERREDLLGPPQVYPRYATRAVAASLLLGADVLERARYKAPGARAVAFITLENDPAVGNAATAALARAWRDVGGRDVVAFEFPESLGVGHDMIDRLQVGANPAATYPVILEFLAP